MGQACGVSSWGSFSYLFGPLLAAGIIVLLIVILRWAFRRGVSVVAAPGRPGRESEYGLLTPIASPPTYVEGELMRRRLEDAGIRANLASTNEGPRLLVFPDDAERARAALR